MIIKLRDAIYFKLTDENHEYYKLPFVKKIDDMDEIWTYVVLDRHPEYNNIKKYIISNYGRILDITTGKQPKQFDSNVCNVNNEHWQRVCLYYDNSHIHGVKYSVHRLVCLAFLYNDDPEHKIYVNHKDGHPIHNYLSNLEWCTPRENLIHAVNNGFITNTKYGEDRSNAVFTNEDVHIVCQLMEEGYKATHIYLVLIGISKNQKITLKRVKSLYKHIRYRTHWTRISSLYNINFKEKV